MKIGIYLGDIEKPESIGDLTFELSFIDELLKQETNHEFIIYYFGEKDLFRNHKNFQFKCLKYFKKPTTTLFPFKFKTNLIPICSFNHKLKKDKKCNYFGLIKTDIVCRCII